MQLDLKSDWQLIRQDPVGQLTGIQLTLYRGKQHFAFVRQGMLFEQGDSPVIVLAITQDKLDLILWL